MGVEVKICGLRRQADAVLALELGAFAIGFVFEPSSPRYVGSPDWSAEWLEDLGGLHVAVYGRAPEYQGSRGFDAVQFVAGSPPATDGFLTPIRVIRLSPGPEPSALAAAVAEEPIVLLDTYDPGVYGGTGRIADWDLAARVVEHLRGAGTLKVGLAGGLTAENVAEAVRAVKPDYVDVSGGVEIEPGNKDPELMRRFVESARSA